MVSIEIEIRFVCITSEDYQQSRWCLCSSRPNLGGQLHKDTQSHYAEDWQMLGAANQGMTVSECRVICKVLSRTAGSSAKQHSGKNWESMDKKGLPKSERMVGSKED